MRSAVTWLSARQVRRALSPAKQSSSPMMLPADSRLCSPVLESISSTMAAQQEEHVGDGRIGPLHDGVGGRRRPGGSCPASRCRAPRPSGNSCAARAARPAGASRRAICTRTSCCPKAAQEPISFCASVSGAEVWLRKTFADASPEKSSARPWMRPAADVDLLHVHGREELLGEGVVEGLRDAVLPRVLGHHLPQYFEGADVREVRVGPVALFPERAEEEDRGLHRVRGEHRHHLEALHRVPCVDRPGRAARSTGRRWPRSCR